MDRPQLAAVERVGRGDGLMVKVVAISLIMFAIVAATLPITTTPGYSSDELG